MQAKNPVKASRMGAPAASVEAYLAALPADARATLEKLRKAIRTAAPQATEGIGYGMPYYKHKGKALIGIAAFREHCSIFPTSAPVAELADDLKKYQVSKGTIRFQIGKPPPATLIRKLIKARIAQIESK